MVSQMDNEKTYDSPIEFQIDAGEDQPPVTLRWDPEEGVTPGDGFKDGLAAVTLKSFIDTYDIEYAGEYDVTPEGPTLKTNDRDIYMVSWAINSLFTGGVVDASADYPTLKDMGLTNSSNYDANGKEIIR